MESSIAEAVLLPWWKIVIYIASLVLAVITIKVTITFDLNVWLKERKEAKELREREKASRKCAHIWTLYPNNPYSRCDRCLILISTSILLTARAVLEPKPVISGELHGIIMKPGKNEMVTSDYVGARDQLD